MFQAFYWDVPKWIWWTNLSAKVDELAQAGFTMMWLPVPYKGASGDGSVGYDPFDHYDLGQYYQRGTYRTRYGYSYELTNAAVPGQTVTGLITKLIAANIMPICDIVLNHMAGGSGGDYKTYTYPDHHKFEKSTTDFHPSTLGHNDELAPYHHNWNFGAPEHHPLDVAFLARNMRSGFKQWGSWLVTDVLYGGFRFDLSEGVEPWLIWEWMSYPAQRGRFAFMEYWDGADGKQMQEWLNLTGKRAAIYDSNLRANYLKPMCNSNGAFDMRKLAPTNCFLGLEPEHTVVFIDNHDTWREGDTNKLGITSNKPLAYAYAFHSQGLPMVFYHDYYEKPYLSNSTAVAFGEPLTNKINRLIRIRKVAVAGNLEVLYSDTNLYIQLRLGNWQKSASILVLNDNSSETLSHSVETPWANTKIVDLVSGTAEVTTEANGSAYLGALPRGYRIYAPTNILQQVEE